MNTHLIKLMKTFFNNFFFFRIVITNYINLKNYFFSNYFELSFDMANLEPWDIDLERPIKRYMIDYVANSSVYGIMYSLKKFAGTNKSINQTVPQHGVYFYGYETSFSYRYCKRIVVMGSKMAEDLEKDGINKPIMIVGPYINYSNDYWGEEKHNLIKKDFGKTLLVFLPHAPTKKRGKVGLGDLIYTPSNVINRIKAYHSQYDSIIVMGWSRTSNKLIRKSYEDAGFVYVVSGDPNDINFLSRQKSIIKLSDHSISFVVSTHVGYCLALGISHEIINLQKNPRFDATNIATLLAIRIRRNKLIETIKIVNDAFDKIIIEKNQHYIVPHYKTELDFKLIDLILLEAFFNSGNEIKENQIESVKPYWGYGIMKTPTEIKNFLV